MDCPECLLDFNEIHRQPKALPCGHTFCLECLEKVDRCYIDRKVFSSIPYELSNNHNVVTLIRSNINRKGDSLCVWCTNCKREAMESCIDEGHKICSSKKIWFQKTLQKLHPSENKFDLQHYLKLVDNLDEAAVAEALEMLSGHVAPLDILLNGATTRWKSTLQLGDVAEEKNTNMLRCLLLLMRMEGTAPKESLSPVVQNETLPRETVDPESILDLTNISHCKSAKEELLSSDSLLKVRHLTGLHCHKDKVWSLKVLRRLAPFLEEVHLYNFYIEHLEVVATMPQLRWLVLEDTDEHKKLADDFKFPVENKVEFLWVNITKPINRVLCKAIVTSYQSSVKVMLVSLPQSYHACVIEFFESLKMPNLQKLFYFSDYCGSDNCRYIMNGLRKLLPNKNVYCFSCGRTDTYDN